MKTGVLISLIGVAICVGFAAGITKEEFIKGDNEYIEKLCAKNDTGLFNDVDKCNEKHIPAMKEVLDKCEEDAVPGHKNTNATFREALCQDGDASKMFEDCINSEVDDEFLEKNKENAEARACIEEALKKHGVEFKFRSTAEE